MHLGSTGHTSHSETPTPPSPSLPRKVGTGGAGAGTTGVGRLTMLFSLTPWILLMLFNTAARREDVEVVAKPIKAGRVSDSVRIQLRDETKTLWMHGYNNYMSSAYPEDVLKPITCTGESRDMNNPGNYARNDVNGNYSLTHLDILSTMAMMRGEQAFRDSVALVLKDTNFDKDVKVQVFEVTIRILGSLLSSYQQLVRFDEAVIASQQPLSSGSATTTQIPTPHSIDSNSTYNNSPLRSNLLSIVTSRFFPSIASSSCASAISSLSRPFVNPKQPLKQLKKVKRKSGSKSSSPASMPVSAEAQGLLNLAQDLANRLLPAFETPFGIPYARVNLKSGIEEGEVVETCTAGAGSLVLEFALLSRLTGEGKYENAARKAFFALWQRRSQLNLMGNSISVNHGQWLVPGTSTIGAGVDSFFEYALKAGILLDDDFYIDVWHDAYAAVMQNLRTPDGYVFRGVHLGLGTPAGKLMDSLAAFWPGLQVLAGDVEAAIKSHLIYWWLWRKYQAIPEGFNYVDKKLEWAGYPLRPEFIESTYHLYRATRDPFYLEVGQRVLADLKKKTMTRCGFAVIHDIMSGKIEDRMESFMLSETLKYLYLLFDVDNPLNHPRSNTVFTTEGHMISLPAQPRHSKGPTLQKGKHAKAKRKGQNLVCPVYRPANLGGLLIGIQGRMDYDYTATVVDMPLMPDKRHWDSYGFCAVPVAGQYHFEMVFTPRDADPVNKADVMPSKAKVYRDLNSGMVVIKDVNGIHAKLTRRMDGLGFDVSGVAHHRVVPGQSVIISDPAYAGYLPASLPGPVADARPAEILLSIAERHVVKSENKEEGPSVVLQVDEAVLASTAVFGRSPSTPPDAHEGLTFSLDQPFLRVVDNPLEPFGCNGNEASFSNPKAEPFIAFVTRGGCPFYDKALTAAKSGASGLIVAGGDDEALIRPSADGEAMDIVDDVTVIYVTRAVGQQIKHRLEHGTELMAQITAKTGGRSLEDILATFQTGASKLLGKIGGGKKPISMTGEKQKGLAADGLLYIEGLPILNLILQPGMV